MNEDIFIKADNLNSSIRTIKTKIKKIDILLNGCGTIICKTIGFATPEVHNEMLESRHEFPFYSTDQSIEHEFAINKFIRQSLAEDKLNLENELKMLEEQFKNL